MSTYVVGDVHGCYKELKSLLKEIKFSESSDTLVFTGDLINGGPDPIDTLNLIMDLGSSANAVLGNHDLTLIGLAKGRIDIKNKSGFLPVIEHNKSYDYINWLQRLDLIHYDVELDFITAHAGILPEWSLSDALGCAREACNIISGPRADEFFENMFGNQPNKWREDLVGWDRIRFIVNAFTRMRFCRKDGSLDLQNKGPADQPIGDEVPWYLMDSKIKQTKIFFGHWAALLGNTGSEQFIGIDTGCMWGGKLSAYRVDDNKIFSVDSSLKKKW